MEIEKCVQLTSQSSFIVSTDGTGVIVFLLFLAFSLRIMLRTLCTVLFLSLSILTC